MTLALTACGVQQLPYDRSTAGIQTIGVVTPGQPQEAGAYLVRSVGQAFGLVGALIDAGMTDKRNTQLRALLRQRDFSTLASFQENLVKTLESGGYTLTTIPSTNERGDFLNAPLSSATPVDAYLDTVMLLHGYCAAGIGSSSPWRPCLAVRTRLIRARDQAVLMQNEVLYNPAFSRNSAVTISPDPAYQFPDFNDLVANPDQATRGLSTATEQTAKAIATLLR